MEIIIRKEEQQDFRIVEELTREAFWNLYVPGCDEHYLVNKMRTTPDFIPELDLVALVDNKIVGNIIYTHSQITDSKHIVHETITFGPISVLPEFQNKGIGKALIEHSAAVAKKLGYKAILIYGYPDYYQRFGFKQSKAFNITNSEGNFPFALLVLELAEGALEGISGTFVESEAFVCDQDEVKAFDLSFPYKEKRVTKSQEEFAKAVSLLL